MGIRLRGGRPDSQPSPLKRKRSFPVADASALGDSPAGDSLGTDGGAASPSSVEGRQAKLARPGLSAPASAAEVAKDSAPAGFVHANGEEDPCTAEPLAQIRVVLKPPHSILRFLDGPLARVLCRVSEQEWGQVRRLVLKGLSEPWDVAVGPDGLLYVADPLLCPPPPLPPNPLFPVVYADFQRI